MKPFTLADALTKTDRQRQKRPNRLSKRGAALDEAALQALREIPILDVLRMLAPESAASLRGSSIRCPMSSYHANGDRSASGFIARDANRVKCYSPACPLGSSGKPQDSIGLVMMMLNMGFKDACRWLQDRFL